VSGEPQPSLYTRARTPQAKHPAPNNVGVVLLVMMMLAIISAVALVAADVVGETRRMVDCMNTPEQAIC
jgi:hypothetical protein